MNDSLEFKHAVILNKYKRVEHSLRPLNSPQERILNPLPFMNAHGMDLFTELSNLPYEFDGLHKVINI